MRNVETQAEIGRNLISPKRDMVVEELEQLRKTFKAYGNINDGLFYSFSQAFYFGVAVGIRQGKAEKKKC